MNWILDFVPYWLWVAIACVSLAATYPMWSAIWMVLPRWLKAAIIFVATVGLAYIAGRNRGVRNERARQDKANAEATKRRLEINEEVDRMPAADRDRELDKWMRD